MLPDGTPVRVRSIRPADKYRLHFGFKRLSEQSRHRRFLHAKQELNKTELQFLTHPDGEFHVALGMVEQRLFGFSGKGIGVGRFIRLHDNPDTAEVSLTVADAYQGRGVGKLLLAYLTQVAIENGVQRFLFYTLGDNRPMQHLLQKTGWDMKSEIELGAITFDAQLVPSDYLSNVIEMAEQPGRNK